MLLEELTGDLRGRVGGKGDGEGTGPQAMLDALTGFAAETDPTGMSVGVLVCVWHSSSD